MRPGKDSKNASVASRGSLGLRDLLRLAGNDLPVEGTLQLALKASGLPAALALDGKIEGRGLAMRFENETGPVSQLDATLRAANGTAVPCGPGRYSAGGAAECAVRVSVYVLASLHEWRAELRARAFIPLREYVPGTWRSL